MRSRAIDDFEITHRLPAAAGVQPNVDISLQRGRASVVQCRRSMARRSSAEPGRTTLAEGSWEG
jgi:hypothetical protein